MLLWATILVVAGIIAGLVAPVMFVLTLVGLALLVFTLGRGRRGARAAAPPSNRAE